jgi:hypothetical protein
MISTSWKRRSGPACIPRFRLNKLVGLALGLLLCLAAQADQPAEQNWARRFRDEAPKKWKEYLTLARHLQGKVYSSWTDCAGNEATQRTLYECKQSDSGVSISVDRLRPIEPRSCYALAVNASYQFKLVRPDLFPWWVIASVGQPIAERGDLDPRSVRTEVLGTLCPGLKLDLSWLPQMARMPEFRVRSVKPVEEGGRNLVRLDFDFDPPASYRDYTRGGYVIFDPEQYWLVQEYEVNADDRDGGKGKLSAKIWYEKEPGHAPLPARQEAHRTGVNSDSRRVDFMNVRHYLLRWRDRMPENEFKLSAFGLPEPRANQSPWHTLNGPSGSGPGCLRLDSTVRVDLVKGYRKNVRFSILNDSPAFIRLVSRDSEWREPLVVWPKQLVIYIPARDKATVEMPLISSKTGHYQFAVPLWYQWRGLRELIIRFDVEVRPAPAIWNLVP